MDRLSRRALIALLVAVSGSQARAQSRYMLSPFAAVNRSLSGSPTLLGAALTSYGGSLGGMLGFRFGGAYDIRALSSSSATTTTVRGWTGDVDAVLSPSRLPVIGSLLGGFLPTLFTGLGVEGLRKSDGTGGQGVVTSYGAGVTRMLGGMAAIETEARHRVPVSFGGSSSSTTPITSRGWEYRLGFSFGFGGKSKPHGIPGLPIPGGAAKTVNRHEPPPTVPASALLTTADVYLGTKYQYGGSAPETGFDCSGFVQYVYRQNGITLPRTSRLQAAAGRSLPTKLDSLRAGDLLFFSQHGDVVDHVAIYAGNDRILHSTSSGGGVRYDDLTTPRGRWFTDRLVAVRRVLGDAAPFVGPQAVAQADSKLDPPDSAPKP